jgi:hypothetical protein
MGRIYEGPTSATSKPDPATPPKGRRSGPIRRATSDLGGHPSYLDRRLRLARHKAPFSAIHQPGPPRCRLQRGASCPAPPGTCRSSGARGSALSKGQAMMRFSRVWEADCSGVQSPGCWTVAKETRILHQQDIRRRDPTPQVSERRLRLEQEARPNGTGMLLGGEKPPWNGSSSYTALWRLPRLVHVTVPTGDEGPWHGAVPALFRHCYNTVAGCRFTILTLVHQPSLTYKRGGCHHKQRGSDRTNTQNTAYKSNNTHHIHRVSTRN